VQRHRGITYATAARWEPPEPVPWDGTGEGGFGPSAPQPTTGQLVDLVPGMKVGAQSEDCLSLNVWAPDGAAGLPVMVWIHGGAYIIGGSSLATYDGTRLADEGVVVVSLNYRLGALGYRLGAHANLAVQDQVAGLRWVHDNIASLGGDPGNVTLFGESAGAGGILHLLGVPAADGLYRRAILQSPGGEVVLRSQAEQLAEAFEKRTGLDAPLEAIIEAQEGAGQDVAHLFGAMPWAPVVDGEVLPRDPRDRVADGIDVDLLVGVTSCELQMFASMMEGLPPEAIAETVRHLLRPILHRDPGPLTELVDAYAGDAAMVLSDAAMAVPAVRLLDSHRGAAHGYVFDWQSPVVGACHASDLPFTFGTFEVDRWAGFVGADADAEALSARMRRSFADFARTGDPGWPAWDAARRAMVFGRTDEVREHPTTARLHLHPERDSA
jgi:para-nitrobenzyl esterase